VRGGAGTVSGGSRCRLVITSVLGAVGSGPAARPAALAAGALISHLVLLLAGGGATPPPASRPPSGAMWRVTHPHWDASGHWEADAEALMSTGNHLT
ncbi:MAG: hypothetical protein SGI90_12285, partial [Candidatus Eisenbacteria bacterium]|nr:hypothetical protein [Candidatus Eisenbacteria bacterium]